MADALGTTSACAENTNYGLPNARTRRNYLRVRGEYSRRSEALGVPPELPPRARRIHIACDNPDDLQGTTSACAENTILMRIAPMESGNYLRVRGEY